MMLIYPILKRNGSRLLNGTSVTCKIFKTCSSPFLLIFLLASIAFSDGSGTPYTFEKSTSLSFTLNVLMLRSLDLLMDNFHLLKSRFLDIFLWTRSSTETITRIQLLFSLLDLLSPVLEELLTVVLLPTTPVATLLLLPTTLARSHIKDAFPTRLTKLVESDLLLLNGVLSKVVNLD